MTKKEIVILAILAIMRKQLREDFEKAERVVPYSQIRRWLDQLEVHIKEKRNK